MKNKQKVILSDRFSLRASNNKFYLVDLNYNGIVFEPYEITKEEYKTILRLNGEETIQNIRKTINKKQLDLIKELKDLGALKYSLEKKRIFPKLSKGPILYEAHFELTKKCNLNCAHCYQEKYLKLKDKDLKINEIEKIAKQLKKLNVVRMSISGGEPFLRDLKKICYLFKKEGIKVDCIFTNGLKISKKDISWLKKEGIFLYISLDGPDPESHGKIRNVPSKNQQKIFNKIIRNIQRLKKAKIIVKINTCIHKYNISKLDEMYSLMKDLKVDAWRMAIPKFVGRYTKTKNNFYVDKKDFLKSILNLVRLFLRDSKKIEGGILVPLDLRISNIFKTEMLINPLTKYSKTESVCDYQKERITIKPNGDIVPCGLLVNHVIGNIKKQKIEDIWKMQELQRLKNIPINKISECSSCDYVIICGGGCRLNSLEKYGDLFHKDDLACECMKIIFGPIKKILKKEGFKLNFVNKKKKFKTKKVFIRNKTNYF